MDIKDNPYINPANYLDGYQESLDKLRQNKDVIQFDKLCFEVLETTPQGRKLQQLFKDRFIYTSTPAQLNTNYDFACIFYEGFREAFRHLLANVESYRQRKEHEAKEANIKKSEAPKK